MRKVLILDTSILCVWLQLPNFDTCGPDGETWDFARVKKKIDQEIANDSTLVLPLATIIETGNHISQCVRDRYRLAQKFAELLIKSIDNTHPWAAFSEQGDLRTDDRLRELSTKWPPLADAKISLGDATITDVAEYYAKSGFEVEIFTGDVGLKAYEPKTPPLKPRRRKR